MDYDETLEDENNPLYQKQATNTFVISNTAITAQKSFITNQEKENSLLTHSKFTPADREYIFEKVFDSFKENGTHKFDIIRSGPIIQAALNISCENMISEMDIAENILQRLGRLNRFGENEIATLKIAITDSIKTGKQTGKAAKFLGRRFGLQSSKVWYEFLSDKLESNADITINELYQWYQEFYENEAYVKMIAQDFIALLKDGVRVIEGNIFEPKRIKLSKNSQIKLKKHSLRGNSRFVNMAVCDIKNRQDTKIRNEYLDTEITMGVNEITGYGGIGTNLLNFMKSRHHNLIGGPSLTRMPYNTILNNARDPEKQIYVSYAPQGLEAINYPAEAEAIYYLQGINQAIGIMALSKL
ncbi:CRISPR-associated helicase Cas3, Yersinia-type [uncultured Candidatus Thioglobus sp.]|nr:CRISPR-associated helicase Cas3, Yersinia-type [uncultured Candidatus Thioglobus sp.]